MKRCLFDLSMLITLILALSCTSPLGYKTPPKTVEISLTCPITVPASGEKSLISDSSVLSVTVTAENSTGTILGTATLTKGASSWTGSMNVTVAGGAIITFRARGWSDVGGTGSMIYYGRRDVIISESDKSINLTIATELQVLSAQWAKTLIEGQNASEFNAVATDTMGNVYAAGSISSGDYIFGTGASIKGINSSYNIALVKYDSSGTAQWARTVTSATGQSRLLDIAVDAFGNIYATGWQQGIGTFAYGNGVTAQGGYSGYNAILVKYDSSGNAQWAQVAGGSAQSVFNSVAVDGSGNIFTAGHQYGNTAFTYGTGVSATGTSYNTPNAVIVKYNSSGAAQWARSVSAGSANSQFNSIAIDDSENAVVAGFQTGAGTYTYGTGVSAKGTASLSLTNIVVVKYDSSGNPLWARTTTSGQSPTVFKGVKTDSLGNVYAAGVQTGSAMMSYGDGVSARSNYGSADNVLLVKYNNTGTAQWAKTVQVVPGSSSPYSNFMDVTVSSSGDIFTVGWQNTDSTYTYDPGVFTTSPYSQGKNIIVVKYDSSGTALASRTMIAGSGQSVYNGMTIDGAGNVFAVGYQTGSDAFTYGTDVIATCPSNAVHSVLVKYIQ
ncbi:MAG TPA: hypothetical protein VIO60_11785 [Rectinemataceae bacterium]